MRNATRDIIVRNLGLVLAEMSAQSDVAAAFPPGTLGFDEQIEQLRAWNEDVNEFGIAYESIVATLESRPFQLSGQTAVKLVEVALLLGFKTTRDKDKRFDLRRPE